MIDSTGSLFLVNSVMVFILAYIFIVPYARKVEVQLTKTAKVEFEAEGIMAASVVFLIVRGLFMMFPLGIGELFSNILWAAVIIFAMFWFMNGFFRWMAIEIPEIACGIFGPLVLMLIAKNLPYVGTAYMFIVGLLLK